MLISDKVAFVTRTVTRDYKRYFMIKWLMDKENLIIIGIYASNYMVLKHVK